MSDQQSYFASQFSDSQFDYDCHDIPAISDEVIMQIYSQRFDLVFKDLFSCFKTEQARKAEIKKRLVAQFTEFTESYSPNYPLTSGSFMFFKQKWKLSSSFLMRIQ